MLKISILQSPPKYGGPKISTPKSSSLNSIMLNSKKCLCFKHHFITFNEMDPLMGAHDFFVMFSVVIVNCTTK